MQTKFDKLLANIILFTKERDWDKYHYPKNLAISISIEANELLEVFLWLTEVDSKTLSDYQMKKVRDEVGDITINLLNFCNKLNINPIDCASEKLKLIKEKYPVDKSLGSAKKYDEL